MAHLVPDPRFNDYDEVQDQKGTAIGFKIKGSNFFFKYDSEGGWKDEDGNKYNSDGILVQKEEDWGVDEENIDQMENLLIDEEAESDDDQQEAPVQKTFIEQVQDIVTKLQGTDKKLRIFIKSRANKQNEFKKIEVKGDNKTDINKSIQEGLKIVDEEERKQLQQSLPKNNVINFSVQDQKRYWFGYVLVTPEQIVKTIEQLNTNKRFGILKSKTLSHLSNQIPTEAVVKAREELANTLNKFNKDHQVVVTLDGVPPKSPLSFIFDLAEECGVPTESLHQIQFNHSSTLILTNLSSALLFVNLYQFVQEDRQLQVKFTQTDENNVVPKAYIVRMDKKPNFTPKDILQKELLIGNTTDGYLKLDIVAAEVYVGFKSLRRLLMYRGNEILIPVGLKLFVKN